MRNGIQFFGAIIMVFLFACNSSETGTETVNENTDEKPELAETKETAKTEKTAETLQFKELNFDKYQINGQYYVGTITTGKKWQDAAGINYIIIAENENTEKTDYEDIKSYEIHAYHYVEKDNKFELIREVKDFQKECDLILECGLCKNSLDVTDLDADNYGEVSFMYYLYCAMDLSPSTMKLMLLEDGNKYAIRGDSYIVLDPASGEKMGGETNVDASFDNAPAKFKNYALEKWKKHQKSFSEGRK